MNIKQVIQRLRETKVMENYSFMTALSILSALIGLVIYPYVIRMTGKEAYGTYIFAFTIASFLQVFMDFGFDAPCAKAIVEARDDIRERAKIVTTLLGLKAGLIILCSVIFAVCIYWVPFMRSNSLICIITFAQMIAVTLFPNWYFQGMKKMKYPTYINLGLRLATIPLILWLVHSPQDINLYAIIVAASIVIGTLIAYICLFAEGVRLSRIPFSRMLDLLRDAAPFFATNVTASLKSLSVKAIIKHCFGVGEVAVYDLAEKIITIPRFFTQNINSALFPEVVANATASRVQRILKYEHVIGISFAVAIALLSYPAVFVLGGQQMLEATYITILLSTTIYTWLVAGAYINFVFIPANRYYIITLNQIVAFVSCILLSLAGLWLWRTVAVVAIGVMLSGFIEIAFCRYMAKHKLSDKL